MVKRILKSPASEHKFSPFDEAFKNDGSNVKQRLVESIEFPAKIKID